jgi:hypothetical protein
MPIDDTTIKGIIDGSITDKTIMIEQYSLLVEQNKAKSYEVSKLTFNERGSPSVEEIERDSRLKRAQTETNRKTFVERYLYLIIQIIFSLGLFVVLFFRVKKYIFTQDTIGSISSSFGQLKQKSTNAFKNYTNANKNKI